MREDHPKSERALPRPNRRDLEGGFRLHEAGVRPLACTVEVDGAAKRVDFKAMQVLLALAEQADETVPKAALFARVWADAAVGDDVLTVAISTLRKALGDRARSPRFIQTVPRVGYRLIAPVEVPAAKGAVDSPVVQGGARRRGGRLALFAGGAAALSLAITAGWDRRPDRVVDPADVGAVVELGPAPAAHLPAAARTAFRRGRFLLREAHARADLERAIAELEQAMSLAADHPGIRVSLAEAWIALAGITADDPRLPLARAAAVVEEALARAPDEAAVLTLAGVVRFTYDWDFAAAEEAFGAAIERDPAHPGARYWYARYLKAMGRFDEALEQAQLHRDLAVEAFAEPLAASILNVARLEERALDEIAEQLALDPSSQDLHCEMARSYAQLGRFDEAVAAYRTALSLGEASSRELAFFDHMSDGADSVEALCRAQLETASRYGFELEPFEEAEALAGARELERAIDALERAFARRDPRLVVIGTELVYEPLRQDPRFVDLLRRIGLPDAVVYR